MKVLVVLSVEEIRVIEIVVVHVVIFAVVVVVIVKLLLEGVLVAIQPLAVIVGVELLNLELTRGK